MVRRSTWIIVLIFAILLGGTILWQRSQESKPTEPAPTQASDVYLFQSNGVPSGLRIERVSDQKVVEVARDPEGIWKLTWPAGLETNTGAVEGALTQLQNITPLSLMDNPPGLEAAGLSQPAYRMLVTFDDDSQVVVNVGKTTPTGSGYYVLTDERGIFVVSTYSLEPILNMVDNPPIALPQMPVETQAVP